MADRAIAEWSYVTIPVEARQLTEVNGQPFEPSLQPGPVGAAIKQWCALGTAARWVAALQKLLADDAAFAAADSPAPGTSDLTNAYTRAFGMLANVYNALNVPWYMDPVARGLYRKYVAGLPTMVRPGQPDIRSLYGRKDYSTGWYTHDREWPTASSFSGLIPAVATRLYHRYEPTSSHPVAFVQTLGLWLDFGPGTPERQRLNLRPAYATSAINRGGALYFGAKLDLHGNVVPQTDGVPQDACRTPTGADCKGTPGALFSGTAFWYNNGFNVDGGAPERAATPMREYLPWLREWAEWLAPARRSLPQVVLDTRFYVTVYNALQNRLYPSFVASAAQIDADIATRVTANDAGLQAVAGVAAGIGGALAPFTGGISALIGGGVALATQLFDSFNKENVGDNFYRDDLGRYKPTIERGWLSGDPTTDDPTTGRPLWNVYEPLPEELPRTVMSILGGTRVLPGQLTSQQRAPQTPATTPSSPQQVGLNTSTSGIDLGAIVTSTPAKIVIAGVLGYTLWKVVSELRKG